MARMERIMGIPQVSKKPSSLRNQRDPPAPRYINKQGAIDIARKLKLTKIGKVGLRITNKTSIDSEMMSKYRNDESTREMSQKSIMDRRKGLEMARNIVESRIGKCIMETNDYEMRRFNREFGKLLDDEDQKKRQMTQKKREFLTRKQKTDMAQTITRSDGRKSPLVPPTADSDRPNYMPNIYPTGATQQYARNALGKSREDTRTESRGKSPGYMRSLNCTRDKSHDSAVGATERFLSSPYMRAIISNVNDEEMTNRVLEGIQEANEHGSPKGSAPRSRVPSATAERTDPDGGEATPPTTLPVTPAQDGSRTKRPVSQGMSLSKMLLTKRLHEIQETSESSSSPRHMSPVPPKTASDASVGFMDAQSERKDSDNGRHGSDDGKVKTEKDAGDTTPVASSPKPPSRGKFLAELMKSARSSPVPGSPGMTHVGGLKSDQDGRAIPKRMTFASLTKRISGTEEDRTESPFDGTKKSKKTTPTSMLPVAAQIALMRTRTNSRKKRRAAKQKIANLNSRSQHLADRNQLMGDPRFTRLSDSLIADSGKARDLYQSSGHFSLPDHMVAGSRTNQSKIKDGKFRQSRNVENLTRFEELLDSL